MNNEYIKQLQKEKKGLDKQILNIMDELKRLYIKQETLNTNIINLLEKNNA